MTEPTDAEIAALRSEFGITSNGRGIKEFTQVRDFARAVLEKWGTPQPVACEPLTDSQPQAGAVPMSHEDAKALILQLVEALERADKISGYPNNRKTITAARAWLEAKK